MIGYLKGTVVGHKKDGVVLLCNDVGYRVFTTTESRLKDVGSPLSLWTYLAVRETALDLYGFETEQELSMFELLLTVSGIGPRSALSTLDTSGIPALRRAILAQDAALLTKTTGVGKKTAEKIVLELKGKIEEDGEDLGSGRENMEAIDALIALGYGERVAREAIERVTDKSLPTTDLIKQALKHVK
ncbi:MAG: Holliday junction branch migration protein RuvA [Candidatus Zambryskibacteria bacterium CG10_big_fil_rev_8_21_14_0_10_42_12]|uniref:Holliday junction branch migration complex subunit RuvA n=1 Tax=Candidatus Zambryskibacteria bacterium CG10_big_fil_rev_8_21_14_0_10_42_12 TaxID=1975115 RepID=A0A2H0QSK3_9BACT|nr:MAG: Holliday junction branch migration protein RuvA [Candidatus Zambryskibacteria bacterium CG10_big_fil_rev_8_21_14_0_10_42_12]